MYTCSITTFLPEKLMLKLQSSLEAELVIVLLPLDVPTYTCTIPCKTALRGGGRNVVTR